MGLDRDCVDRDWCRDLSGWREGTLTNETREVKRRWPFKRTMRLTLGHLFFIADWTIGHPIHGPQTWPWWRLVHLFVVRLPAPRLRRAGWRLWVYTRWGAVFFDFYNRKPK